MSSTVAETGTRTEAVNSRLTIAAHILAVLDHHGVNRAVTSDELAQGFGTNPVVIRRVLGQLQGAGLIESRRGVGGGSVLARPADEITLGDAYVAVSADDETLFRRHPGGDGDASGIAPIIARYLDELYSDAERALLQSLEAVTVAGLGRTVEERARALGLLPPTDERG